MQLLVNIGILKKKSTAGMLFFLIKQKHFENIDKTLTVYNALVRFGKEKAGRKSFLKLTKQKHFVKKSQTTARYNEFTKSRKGAC